MKNVNKGILDNDTVILAENVQKMDEIIALTCIKTVIVRSGKDLHYLYKGLLRDMNRSKGDYSPFSNAYDIAQEAMLFLCQHMGKKLGDDYTTKYGKVVTIKSACYRCADNYLQKQYTRYMANTISLNERIMSEPVKTFDEEQKNDYTAVDRFISKMKLTVAEYETLCAYMAGLKTTGGDNTNFSLYYPRPLYEFLLRLVDYSASFFASVTNSVIRIATL